MASGEYLDIFNEYDSEDDFTFLAGRCSSFNNAMSEFCSEMDVSKFYKMLMTDDLIHEFGRSDRVPMKSKAVQTDPEASGIPPSWLMAAEDLVNKLYIDLGNMINTLFHNPNGYCKEGTRQGSNPNNLKYFTFVDGCWQSTLMPHTSFFDRQINSKEFKGELNSLLEIASKMKDIMPFWNEYVKETASKEESQRKENLPVAKNDATKMASGDAGHAVCTATCSTLSVDVPRPVNASSSSCASLPHSSSSCSIPEISDWNSEKTGCSLPMNTCTCKPKTNSKVNKESSLKANGRNVKLREDRERLLEQGVAVSKYYLPSTGSISVQSNPNSFAVKKRQIKGVQLADNVRSNQSTESERIAVEGKVPNRRRRPLTQISESDVSCPYRSASSLNDLKVKKSIKNNGNIKKPTNDQENSKGLQCASNRVNFIKRNILAVKTSVIRGANV